MAGDDTTAGARPRWALLCPGLFFMALGIALVTKAQLGTTAISSVPYVLSLIFPLSFGVFTILLNTLFVLAQKLLLGRMFGLSHLLQLPTVFLFGLFIDVAMWLTGVVLPAGWPDSYWAQQGMVVQGSLVLGLGISLEVASATLVLPGEGMVLALAWRLHKDFGPVKIAFDLAQVALAAALSLCFLQTLVGLREGTVLSAVLVGWSMRFFSRWIQPVGR